MKNKRPPPTPPTTTPPPAPPPVHAPFRVRAVGLLLPLLAALAAGCTGSKTSDRSIAFVTPAEAEALVQGRRRLLGIGGEAAGAWVDPRSAREFREGHIPGAIHLAAEEIRDHHRMLREFDVVIVYGESYNDPIAIGASKELIELGHEARTLRGGLAAWEAAGHRIERGDGAGAPGR